jgi:hypothetical protein
VIYDLPFGSGRRYAISNEALDLALGGWGLNMINTMTSGLPLDISYSPTSQAQVSSLVTERPNPVPGVSPCLNGPNPIDYLNPNAFSVPSYTQPFGNTPRKQRAHAGVLRNRFRRP